MLPIVNGGVAVDGNPLDDWYELRFEGSHFFLFILRHDQMILIFV